jgi:hypothetical protein
VKTEFLKLLKRAVYVSDESSLLPFSFVQKRGQSTFCVV